MSLWGAFLHALKDALTEWNVSITMDLPTFYTNEKKMEPKVNDTLILERKIFTEQSTIGELRIDGDFACYTLEDTCRAKGIKVPGKTAISPGRYEIAITDSIRFKRPLPLLLAVPDFEGVRIHAGNAAEDTEGCILLGTRKDVDVIYDSRKAFDLIFPEIQKRLTFGKLYISIIGGRAA